MNPDYWHARNTDGSKVRTIQYDERILVDIDAEEGWVLGVETLYGHLTTLDCIHIMEHCKFADLEGLDEHQREDHA